MAARWSPAPLSPGPRKHLLERSPPARRSTRSLVASRARRKAFKPAFRWARPGRTPAPAPAPAGSPACPSAAWAPPRNAPATRTAAGDRRGPPSRASAPARAVWPTPRVISAARTYLGWAALKPTPARSTRRWSVGCHTGTPSLLCARASQILQNSSQDSVSYKPAQTGLATPTCVLHLRCSAISPSTPSHTTFFHTAPFQRRPPVSVPCSSFQTYTVLCFSPSFPPPPHPAMPWDPSDIICIISDLHGGFFPTSNTHTHHLQP